MRKRRWDCTTVVADMIIAGITPDTSDTTPDTPDMTPDTHDMTHDTPEITRIIIDMTMGLEEGFVERIPFV